MAKTKCLTYTSLTHLVSKIKTQSVPTETHYRVELTANQAYTFTIPSYSSTKSIVEVYLNGLRLIPTYEYTLSSAGLMTLIATLTTSDNILHIVHTKWS